MKKFAKLCCLILMLALMLSLSAPAWAEGTVTYSGSTRTFIFAPGSSKSPTDLFNFENVMPGDTLTERIVVKNNTYFGVKINVYLRSLGAQLDTDDFLSQLELSVQQVDDSYMFKAPADQTAQLTNWTHIGTIYSGGEVVLDLTLKVPFDLDDKFQNSVGYIDWEFKVEELPISPTDPNLIKTGDNAQLWLYACIVGGSLMLWYLLFFVARRRKKAE